MIETHLGSPLFWILGSTAIVFIIAGIFSLIKPPKKINPFYGYRTKLSRKSQEHWDYAQPYSSKMMIAQGFYLALMSVSLPLATLGNLAEVLLSIFLLLFSLSAIVLSTEYALKRKFRT